MEYTNLPSRPDLDQYRKQAKDLAKAYRAGEAQALDAVREHHPEFKTVQDSAEKPLALADAQLVIARRHHFKNWTAFKGYVLARQLENQGRFGQAVQAIITGDSDKLRDLVLREPKLIQARSASWHRSTLLHYVAANGIESDLQKSPPNGPEIARFLLDSGAEVDALADTYGKDHLQTTMNLLVSSVHPALAGTQVSLVDALLDGGAAINGIRDDGSPLITAIIFVYTPAVDRLVQRRARVDTLMAAAGVGDLEKVRTFFGIDGRLRSDVQWPAIPWVKDRNDAEHHMARAFLNAVLHERMEVAEYLLEHGAEINRKLTTSTALHEVAWFERMKSVRFLVEHGADLTIQDDTHHGTPLDWAEYGGKNVAAGYLRSVTPGR